MSARQQEAALVAEALVREIGRAQRWSAVVEAWHALLNARRIAGDMEREAEHLTGVGALIGNVSNTTDGAR